ncbi:MAG: GNAT family N-acetyltransferase [Candidatus Sulfotelmatobacter sp.]
MGISTFISRLALYHQRNGSGATVRRAALEVSRALFSNRMVLFYCDLSALDAGPVGLPGSLTVERKGNETEVSSLDLAAIIDSWNSKVAHRFIKERFGQGASLWMIKSEGRLAGYGWTLQGETVEPHYFRLGPEDIHLFDFYVFPSYRGQGLNPLLLTHILHHLTTECTGRAFIEAAEWNHAQLASLRKTAFHRLGQASKFTIFRRTVVCWNEDETAKQEPEGELNSIPIAASGRKGSGVPDLRA